MQIRLTVVDPLGPPSPMAPGRAASRDVLVTAPAGTALAAVASALAAAVAGDGGAADGRGAREPGAGPVVLYAGADRLDAQRCTLGEPPLLDGAVLSVGAPAQPEPHPELDEAPARLHVVAGPDAGGVHLLHGGQITVGRSADADVPLDDPDVSRVHCAVTLASDGRVSVADLGSTNGTVLDGRPVDPRPVRFVPGALLRVGESVLRLTPSAGPADRLETAPDGEGHARVAPARAGDGAADRPEAGGPAGAVTTSGTGAAAWAAPAPTPFDPTVVPAQGGAPRIESRGGDTHAGRFGATAHPGTHPEYGDQAEYGDPADRTGDPDGGLPDSGLGGSGRKGTPLRGTDVPQGLRRRGGLGAWARRLTGGRGEPTAARDEAYPAHEAYQAYDDGVADAPGPALPETGTAARLPETWPDPAALLLTALGPGPRLWERGPGHPEALTVRLGTADRPAPDGSGRLLPAVPVTADLREVGALGLAGPRARLSGLARAVLAQLAALHSPGTLEIVLLSTDRARPSQERAAEWSWLGWLPQVRPGHGQDCRLLLAYDREQAAARTGELLRRLEDHLTDTRTPDRAADGTPDPATHPATAAAAHPADHPATGQAPPADGAAPPAPYPPEAAPAAVPPARRPSWARDEEASGAGAGHTGPYTVVVVDGDPGGATVRDALVRLAQEGPRAGIHVVCLAEAEAASPASPVTETYEAACAVSPVFRECGAVALLSGDVATALHLMRVARADGRARGPVAPGTVAVLDAVSPAWAERFARALAPLRPVDGPEGAEGNRPARVSAPLPLSARLLDELGLARATPASLQARWADAADDSGAVGGRACAILGAGPRGPVCADLVADGPHLLVEGPAGSGRTELLRSVVASLAAAERPDRLGVVLVDGRDGTGTGGPAEGLRVCTDVPHVTTHLTANDPVRMREFAQSLSAELKRRAELLGISDFAAWHGRRTGSGRVVAQRTASPGTPAGAGAGAADLDTPPSSTLRLRPAAARARAEAAPPLPRLVVVVDDLDALVSPALGSPGRPAAGSVVRALEAVAREGERLGVHLVAATAPGGRTERTEPVRRATLRVLLEPPVSGRGSAPAGAPGPEAAGSPAPGRGRLTTADGRTTPFQGGRVTGRIPRTATQRPTVVPLDWDRMGDPPTRRSVRELGNGPTDLALLASALERAAREVSAARVPSLI
ncbi:FHA domain-containing protein [Streptomyces sp. PsTaAH-124]|uniref:FHA domain-containing protein n=1 Tax=Streptomyces sp. PsTaAH-124 TaxID=1157638 RepID=UPI0004772100|nr:FHA domain-containing protein [Streptomyces sp. PsTaAH-124]